MTKTSWIYGAALWMINGLLLLPLNAREFKSANGKVIEAELVSATPDGKIVIRRGTKEFTVAASGLLGRGPDIHPRVDDAKRGQSALFFWLLR